MTISNEWSDRSNEQLSVSNRVRNLALRSLNLMERAADWADQQYDSGKHPENFIEYFKSSFMVLNPENIDTLSRVIDRTIHTDFKVSSQKYNDINSIAKEMNRLGYKIIPKKQAEAEKPVSKGYSPETVNALRAALYRNTVGSNKN